MMLPKQIENSREYIVFMRDLSLNNCHDACLIGISGQIYVEVDSEREHADTPCRGFQFQIKHAGRRITVVLQQDPVARADSDLPPLVTILLRAPPP